MNEPFIKNVKIIKKAIAEGKLVVFAGAGISIDSGAPSWQTLIDSLRDEIDIPSNETDFLRIAQMYYNERQQKEFVDKVREILNHRKLRYNEIHEAVFDLNPEHIMTTNFDDLLEQVIKAKAYPFSVIKKDLEFPYGRNTKLLIKVHGDLDEANLVIKEDDYLQYSQNHPLIESFIKGVFANKVVLFIGYTFSDINLKIILQSVRNILGRDFQNAYLLSTESNFHPAKRHYLKQQGINVISYADAGESDGINAIEQYLFASKNALNYQFGKRNESLSDQGRDLLYLIKFITKYMDFAESLINKDPVTQMYVSLKRFDEINALPPTFLSNLFPFNRGKGFIHNYSEYTLGSNNNEIRSFFFDYYDQATLELNDKYFLHYNIPLSKKTEFQKRLHYIIRKMNFASISYFGRSTKKVKIEIFNSPQEMRDKVSIFLDMGYCDCLSCLYYNLQLKDFFKKLKEASITETSNVQEDLLLAFSNYKVGNFKIAYSQFEEIANKAWQLGKYISYYIAKQNVKYLRNLIHWEDDSDTEKTIDIVTKIDDLDLDKLLFSIPALDNEEYNLLRNIRDNEILLRAESEITELYNKVLSLYEHYKRGGHSTGPNYPHLIEEQLHRLFMFYTYNYLVNDAFSNFLRVIQTGITALLISYATNKRQPQRLIHFDFAILKYIIFYGDEDTVLNTINDYPIKELTIEEIHTNEALRVLNNLFQSIFVENNFLGRTLSSDNNITSQNKNFFFQNKLRSITHNAFIVFGAIKIPSEYSNVLIRNFLDFLRTQDILVHYSDKFFSKFLFNIKDHFSYDDFIELLKIYVDTDAHYANDEFFQIIGLGLKERYPEQKINNDDLLESIIAKSLNPKLNRHKIGFLYLWKVSSELNKQSIQKALVKELSKTFEPYAYLHSCFEGIFPESTFYDSYIIELEKFIPKDIEWEDGKPKEFSFMFRNFVNLLYGRHLIGEQIPFKKWNHYPDYWKFYFDPKGFDYSKFKAQWLLIINTPVIHELLNKIPEVCLELKKQLKEEYQEELGKIYTQFYL